MSIHDAQIKHETRVVSFSLYGNKTKFTNGAIHNAELCNVIYPGWKCRFYVDDSVSKTIVNSLIANDAQVVLVSDIRGASAGRFWRFLIADDETVDRFIVRDVDSRLNMREAKAVEEWIQSGVDAHIMRDYPSHGKAIFPMLAGMWGCKKQVIPFNMKQAIQKFRELTTYNSDQNFLREQVYPHLQHRHLSHDSVSCT